MPDIWCGFKIPVLGLAGEFSSGKTLFGLTIDPDNTLVIDMEESSATYSSLPIKKRVSFFDEMVARTGGKRIPSNEEKFVWFRDLIMNMPSGEYSVLFVDPITDIEDGLVEYVENHPDEFGLSSKQMTEAGGLKWGAVNAHWNTLIGFVSRKVETLAFTAHMGNVWDGGRPVKGARKAKGKTALRKLASLYIELRREVGKDGRVAKLPTGLVFGDNAKERMSIWVPSRKEFVQILPPRIEECTPAKIREFIKNPVGLRDLKKSELLPPKPELSPDEKLLLQAQIAEDQRAAEEAKALSMAAIADGARAGLAKIQAQQSQPPQPQQQVTEPVVQQPAQVAQQVDIVREAFKEIEEELRPEFKQKVEACMAICRELKASADQVKATLAKYGVDTWEKLTPRQLDELHAKLSGVAASKK